MFMAVNNSNVWLIIQVTGMKLNKKTSKCILADSLRMGCSRYAPGNPQGFSNNLCEDTEKLL